jgi:hypothetical protein
MRLCLVPRGRRLERKSPGQIALVRACRACAHFANSMPIAPTHLPLPVLGGALHSKIQFNSAAI